MKIEHLKIEDLETNKVQPHRRTDVAGLARLKESLKRYGVMRPITVQRVGKRLIILDGHRTAAAWAELGNHTIPCVVIDGPSLVASQEAFAVMNIATSKMAGRAYLEQWAKATDGEAHLVALGSRGKNIRVLIKMIGETAAREYGKKGDTDPSVVNVVKLFARTVALYRTPPTEQKICHWLIKHKGSVQARFVCTAGLPRDIRKLAEAIDLNVPCRVGRTKKRRGAQLEARA